MFRHTEGEQQCSNFGEFKHWRLPERISVATLINEIFSPSTLQVESYNL